LVASASVGSWRSAVSSCCREGDAGLERFPIRWNIAGVGEVVGAFGWGEGVEARPIVRQRASTVRRAAVLSRVLSLAKACSIGFRSGL
jgi:hypothetical protein